MKKKEKKERKERRNKINTKKNITNKSFVIKKRY
jgi:hypothetical protein